MAGWWRDGGVAAGCDDWGTVMSRVNPDIVYAALAGAAVGGVAAPLLFPMAAGLKTASYLASLTASGILAYGHESGLFSRQRQQHKILQESRHEVFIQQTASKEALELRRIEIAELVETLVMLDDLSPIEQRHFLDQMGLPELMSIYIESRQQKEALPAAIEVPARKVEESPFGDEKLRWAVDSVIAQSSQQMQQSAAKTIDETFPEIDLGKTIAEMMVFGQVPLNVLLACPPRTGKTTTLTVTLAWLCKLTEGRATVNIRNGKENIDHETGKLKDDFLGLAYDPRFYKAVETSEEAAKFSDFYAEFAATMRQPRKYPDLLIVDEFNNIRAAANRYDGENDLKGAQSKLKQIDRDTDLLITQGTSRKKFVFYTSHSSYVTNIGVDRSYQDGMYTIVLGRGGAMNAIFKSLDTGTMGIVKNKPLAKKLMADFQQWLNSPSRDQSKVVVLTNLIDNNFGLYFVKYIDLDTVKFDPMPSSVEPTAAEDPYEVWDEEFEEDNGHQPEEDPNWEKTQTQAPKQPKSKPPTTNPIVDAQDSKALNQAVQDSQRELVAVLLEWIRELGHQPSDAELKAKLKEMLRNEPSDRVLNGVKYLLSQNGCKFD